MSWKIEEHSVDDYINVKIEIANGHHIYYANTITIGDLNQYFNLCPDDIFEIINGRTESYQNGDKIFVCRAKNTSSATETQKIIPINSFNNQRNNTHHVWLLLIIENDTSRTGLKIKRTSNKVSDVYPHKKLKL